MDPSAAQGPARPDDAGAMLVVLAVVVSWPILLDLGRGPLAVAAAVLLAVRAAAPLIRRRVDDTDARAVVAAGVAGAVTLGFAAGWTAASVCVALVALVAVVRPELGSRLNAAPAVDEPHEVASPAAGAVMTGVLAGFGILLAVWHIGSAFWASDNAGYLNKAMQYADRPFTAPIDEPMFGLADMTPISIGNVLSSFEPLVGVGAAISGRSAADVLFVLVTPVLMFLVPFAIRHAARGVGLDRADLAGCLGSTAILLMTAAPTTNLFAVANYGKISGQLVFVPVLVGAMAALRRSPGPRASVLATLAAVGTVGMSPSLALGAGIVVAAFSVEPAWGAVVGLRTDRRAAIRRAAPLLTPALFTGLFLVTARQIQATVGESQYAAGFRSFDAPLDAWTLQFGIGDTELLAVFLLLGATAAVPLLVPGAAVRRSLGFLMLLVFAVVFGPWTFDLVVEDLLDLNHFAWRFFWGLPVVAFMGFVLATVDRRSTWRLATIVATVIGLGLSGPTLSGGTLFFRGQAVEVWNEPFAWPWETGVPAGLEAAAVELVEATPSGGTFLAPPQIEEVAAALQVERLPTYTRNSYVEMLSAIHPDRSDFHGAERKLLADGMRGRAPDGTTAAQWASALDTVGVDTVCLGPQVDPGLRIVVQTSYSAVAGQEACELWASGSKNA